ncbi:hypothetical protein MJA45_03140 [Paenibacillus aurantius]|uniref:Uncharacterized protein n=1 Tax=Paenibacillus aurantius TaxID=2918900 RepID=A0AA96RFJ4_9BACL|nr:hypothetical protein [Paenibacillus aurantius]WNQ12072.1 hypothetical protein MJA45_03140 [Paenibacillus aurantius]
MGDDNESKPSFILGEDLLKLITDITTKNDTKESRSKRQKAKQLLMESLSREKALLKNRDYTLTSDIIHATHWRAGQEAMFNGIEPGITGGKVYRLYIDKYEKKEIIFDDNGNLSMIYAEYSGDFLIIE